MVKIIKLNHDCIRDILLFTEQLPFGETAKNNQIFKSELLNKYSEDELNYAITRMGNDDAELVIGKVKYASNKPYITTISSLTFKGHKYLDNIRDPKVWKESKKLASKLSSVSIDILSDIASTTVMRILGLN